MLKTALHADFAARTSMADRATIKGVSRFDQAVLDAWCAKLSKAGTLAVDAKATTELLEKAGHKVTFWAAYTDAGAQALETWVARRAGAHPRVTFLTSPSGIREVAAARALENVQTILVAKSDNVTWSNVPFVHTDHAIVGSVSAYYAILGCADEHVVASWSRSVLASMYGKTVVYDDAYWAIKTAAERMLRLPSRENWPIVTIVGDEVDQDLLGDTVAFVLNDANIRLAVDAVVGRVRQLPLR